MSIEEKLQEYYDTETPEQVVKEFEALGVEFKKEPALEQGQAVLAIHPEQPAFKGVISYLWTDIAGRPCATVEESYDQGKYKEVLTQYLYPDPERNLRPGDIVKLATDDLRNYIFYRYTTRFTGEAEVDIYGHEPYAKLQVPIADVSFISRPEKS